MITLNNKSYIPSDFITLNNELRELIDKNELWVSVKQLAIIFQCSDDNIELHIKNVYKTRELESESTSKIARITQREGERLITRNTKLFNYEMMISLSYKINLPSAIEFRKYSIKHSRKILSEYIVQGISINKNEENVLKKLDKHLIEMRSFSETITNLLVNCVLNYNDLTEQQKQDFTLLVKNKLQYLVSKRNNHSDITHSILVGEDEYFFNHLLRQYVLTCEFKLNSWCSKTKQLVTLEDMEMFLNKMIDFLDKD